MLHVYASIKYLQLLFIASNWTYVRYLISKPTHIFRLQLSTKSSAIITRRKEEKKRNEENPKWDRTLKRSLALSLPLLAFFCSFPFALHTPRATKAKADADGELRVQLQSQSQAQRCAHCDSLPLPRSTALSLSLAAQPWLFEIAAFAAPRCTLLPLQSPSSSSSRSRSWLWPQNSSRQPSPLLHCLRQGQR